MRFTGDDDEPHFKCEDKLQSLTSKLPVGECGGVTPVGVEPQVSGVAHDDTNRSVLAQSDANVSSVGDGSSMAIEEIEMDGSD